VITSDNTATDLSIAKVGGVAKVNAWLADKGYADQKLTQTTGDLFAKYNALKPTDDRNAKTNADKSYWLGEITPKGMGLMFEGIEKKAIASAASCDAMLRMLRGQQAGQRRLNHFIQALVVAHKTGDFPPVLANDVGIIYARSGPIVVSFLGNAITGNYGEAEDRIGRAAQQIVEYFDK
jgi:beta-lactamase class A